MTLKEIHRQAKAEGKQDICRFMRDVKRLGLRMQPYNGRFYWHGPAVSTDDLKEVLGATRVKCQWDNLGLGWIVYPRQSLGVRV
jgi:hypothetical protein